MTRHLLLLVLALVYPAAAGAHGAVAIGLPPDVAKAGIALGISWDYPTSAEAEAGALRRCRDFKDAPESTRALCKIYRTYSRQCVAVALDPKDGTPGWGWATAETLPDAENRAMAMCKDTAGADRVGYCELTVKRCDTRP
jgi:uncharacterized protein DUF4189